jgi:hypothetical protein
LSTSRARQRRPPASGARSPVPGRRQPRPLPKGNSLFTPGASPARQDLEHRSATVLLWMHQLPAWLPPALAAVLLIAGLAIPGLGGAIALCGLAVILAWLAAVSWPRVSAQGKLVRALVIGVVLAGAAYRALHG